MPCYSPLKGYKDRATGGLTFRKDRTTGERMTVSCGGCLGCRLDRSRVWAARIVHEASLYDDNCFVTLTYRDKDKCTAEQLAKGLHLPEDGSLHKEHFQKFMKRLRKRFAGRKIRYYQCGEYGEELERPHYHACLFNLDFSDKQLFKERDGILLFTSQTLEEVWGYGFVTVGELTQESAAYTARYCLKKVTGHLADDHYLRVDDDGVAFWLEPEYTTMSRRPGIGKEWYEKYKKDLFPSDEVPVPGSGVFKKVPRFYEELHAGYSPGEVELVKEKRREHALKHKEEYSPERLWQKYKVKKAQLAQLKRTV